MDFKRNIWLQRAYTFVVCVCALLLIGLIVSPLQRKAWGEVRSLQPELNLREVEGALGQGLVIGLLGGFRTIIADMVFIRANVYWEKKDREKMHLNNWPIFMKNKGIIKPHYQHFANLSS